MFILTPIWSIQIALDSYSREPRVGITGSLVCNILILRSYLIKGELAVGHAEWWLFASGH
jgi:hypothetical protein